MRKMQGNRRLQVLKLLSERMGQPGKPAHAHRSVTFCLSTSLVEMGAFRNHGQPFLDRRLALIDKERSE
jgi:hypothetical protein